MTKGLSTKQRFVITARELESLMATRAYPVGRRITKSNLAEFWITTNTGKNEEWDLDDLRVLELVS
jgi:hypothetical protein